jgi:hypothetical protein
LPSPSPPGPPSVRRAARDDQELEFRFRFKEGELLRLMAGRTDMRTFSESIAKLVRRTALRAAKEPPVPARRERAEAFLAEIEKRGPRSSARAPSTSRSLFDFIHPDFLPAEERRRQRHRVADGREDLPSVGPPRPDRLVLVEVAEHDAYRHVRRRKSWLPHSQRAIWANLDPKREGDGVGRGDGDVLAFLLHLGVTPDEWEALPGETQVSIRESVRKLLVIGRAVSVALDPLDPKLAQRAVALLEKLSEVVANNRNSPKGFETALAQRERWASGRGLHLFVVHLFDLVKKHFRPALVEASGSKAAELANEVNTLLTERYGPDAARCIGQDIAALHSQSSADAAKVLVRRIDSKIDVDLLDRARPRHRNRKKKPRPAHGTGSAGQ